MKTPISYYGGKQTMLKHILPLIPQHTLYTEAFCGGCAVMFAKKPVDCEIINDLNRGLINFYWIASMYYPDLKKEIDKTLHSRDIHAHAMHINTYPEFFSNVQWAWSIWALSKLSFASMQDGSFGYDRAGTTAKKISNAKDDFTVYISKRLSAITIENTDALDVIQRYDCEGAFHFVDPPYINSDCGHYEGFFNEDNMRCLLELLTAIKGKFMLTMFPFKMIEDCAVANGWVIHRVERTISASRENRRKQEEWMVCNYETYKQTSIF